jgi:ribosomal-protein-alanine N-acetyltransferase
VLFSALPTSEHELVELRPIVEADLVDWYAYLSQPVVYEHTSWNLSSKDELAHYAEPSSLVSAESLLRMAVALRSSGKLVGTVGFHSVSPLDRRAELAFDLSPEVWGKGIATHVCATLVEWAHAQAGVVRVQATALQSNLRSAAVLSRCGFQFEGVLRSYRVVRGAPGNFGMYAHLVPGSGVT